MYHGHVPPASFSDPAMPRASPQSILEAWERLDHRYLLNELLADVVNLARAFPNANIIAGHVGGPLGYGPYSGKKDEAFATWKALDVHP
jgi:L-fuconolactonase